MTEMLPLGTISAAGSILLVPLTTSHHLGIHNPVGPMYMDLVERQNLGSQQPETDTLIKGGAPPFDSLYQAPSFNSGRPPVHPWARHSLVPLPEAPSFHNGGIPPNPHNGRGPPWNGPLDPPG